jgi:hypothetical protein
VEHSRLDHGLGELEQLLVVSGQALPSAELTRCPLDHPSAREDDEAGDAGYAADDGIAHRPSTDTGFPLETG